jgi:hypothetical protein
MSVLTFGGVPFCLDLLLDGKGPLSQECPPLLKEWLDKFLPTRQLADISTIVGREGRAWSDLASRSAQSQGSPRIGEFYYPFGASRFAVFRGLATTTQKTAMVAATSNCRVRANFVMEATPVGGDSGLHTVETGLYMLPPRCLSEVSGAENLYLVTLVDERYYWRDLGCPLGGYQLESWGAALGAIALRLGIDLEIPSVGDTWGVPEPDSQLWSDGTPAGVLLDAVAANLGRTVVRKLNGTYRLLSAADSALIVDDNLDLGLTEMAGGDLLPDSGVAGSIVPESVTVNFPIYRAHSPAENTPSHFYNARYGSGPVATSGRTDYGSPPSAAFEDSYGAYHPVTVGAAEAGSPYGGVSGLVHTINDTAKLVIYSDDDEPTNNTGEIEALALQIAAARYAQLGPPALDKSFAGSALWEPEGVHDLWWCYSAQRGQASLRVCKGEWMWLPNQMQHCLIFRGSQNVVGVGGRTVPLTVGADAPNSSGDGETFGFSPPLKSSGTNVSLFGPPGFPTGQYFKAWGEDFHGNVECMLLFGTGPTSVEIVRRGIDGTRASSGDVGNVTVYFGQQTYGVNSLRFGPGQFVLPNDPGELGLRGAHVIPQTQTVRVENFLGGGIYLGSVLGAAEATGGGGGNRSNTVIRDRNGFDLYSGRAYDGQFVGWHRGLGLPQYLVNEYPFSSPTSGSSGGSSGGESSGVLSGVVSGGVSGFASGGCCDYPFGYVNALGETTVTALALTGIQLSYTTPANGFYHVTANCQMSLQPVTMEADIQIDIFNLTQGFEVSSLFTAIQAQRSGQLIKNIGSITAIDHFVSGDVVEVRARKSNSTSTALVGANSTFTYMKIASG